MWNQKFVIFVRYYHGYQNEKGEHLARMGGIRNLIKTLTRNLKESGLLEVLAYAGKDNIKTDIK
jgi:hypothetical protein